MDLKELTDEQLKELIGKLTAQLDYALKESRNRAYGKQYPMRPQPMPNEKQVP